MNVMCNGKSIRCSIEPIVTITKNELENGYFGTINEECIKDISYTFLTSTIDYIKKHTPKEKGIFTINMFDLFKLGIERQDNYDDENLGVIAPYIEPSDRMKELLNV